MSDKGYVSDSYFIYPGRNDKNNYTPKKQNTQNHVTKKISTESYKFKNYSIFSKFFKSKLIVPVILSCSVLSFSVLSILFFSNVFGKIINNIQFFDYNKFLYPVVMQDPAPFSESNPPPNCLIMNASIWKAASEKNNNSDNYDENGKILVTLDEAKQACTVLFGNDINLNTNDKNLSGNFYEYNKEKEIFYVNCISYDQCYVPNTIDIRDLGNIIILKVNYLKIEPYPHSEKCLNSNTSAQKCMEYHLKRNLSNNQFYICELKKYSKN